MSDYARSTNPTITLSHPRDTDDDDDDNPLKHHALVVAAAAAADPSPSSSSGKKPRGRPPGSKNKPKPPIVITRESESAMHHVILELAPGCDVLDAVSGFSRRRRVGVSVLSGTGSVANVSLRHPTSLAATVTLHGRFEMLSLSGTVMPPSAAPAAAGGKWAFTISVAGAQGQVIGGTVAGGLTAAGTVVVVAATFVSPEYYRLPIETEGEAALAEEEEDVKPRTATAVAASGEVYGGPHNQMSGHEMALWGPPPPHSPRAPSSSHY